MLPARLIIIILIIGLGAAAGCSDDTADDSASAPEGEGRGDAGQDRRSPDAAAAAPDGATPGEALPELCSGCEDEQRDVGENDVHFHHVHLNTQDRAASEDFYQRVFGAERVRLNDRADVIKADGAFVLLDVVDETPTEALDVGIEHFGWGRMDLLAWWSETESKRGVMLDQRNGPLDGPFELFPDYYFLYLQGPSNERVEVESESPPYLAFKHVHFMTDDVNATVAWYEALLGKSAEMPEAIEQTLDVEFNGAPIAWSINTLIIDNVKMLFFGPPFQVPEAFTPTDDHPFGHVAFAFAELAPVLERARAMDVEIVAEPAIDEAHGFRSCFLRGPNQVLVELVEAAEVPNPFP